MTAPDAGQDALLPCPFCGGRAVASKLIGFDGLVTCEDHRCLGNQIDASPANWNRRTPSPAAAPPVAQGDAREALRDAAQAAYGAWLDDDTPNWDALNAAMERVGAALSQAEPALPVAIEREIAFLFEAHLRWRKDKFPDARYDQDKVMATSYPLLAAKYANPPVRVPDPALPVAQDTTRLDSGTIRLHERDEFGEEYFCVHRGLDLRKAIDDAIADAHPPVRVPEGGESDK